MSSNRVFLTYNRRRVSSRTVLGQGNGSWDSLSDDTLMTASDKHDVPSDKCHRNGGCDLISNGLSDTLTITSDKHDAPSDKHISEDQKPNSVISLECVVCGAIDNLLQCGDCQKSYHLQCLDRSLKHVRLAKRLCSDCFKKRSQPVRKSSRLKAKKHIQGSNVLRMAVKSQKPLHSQNPGEGPSGNDRGGWSSVDISLKNKSIDFQNGSCSNVNFSPASNNGCSESRLVSQSTGMKTALSLDFIGLKSADEGKYSLPCDDGSSMSKTSNLGVSKHKFSNLSGDLLSKMTTPLITFSRRNKRKKDLQADALEDSSPVENNCSLLTRWSNSICVNTSSSETTSHKGRSTDHSGHLELPWKNSDAANLCCNQDKMCEVQSLDGDAGPVLEIRNLICEDKQSHDDRSISMDDLPAAGQVPLQSSKVDVDVQETSLNNTVRESSSNGIVVDEKSKDSEFNECIEDESQILSSNGVKATEVPECTREELLPCLNHSANHPDSCCAMGYTIDINLSPQKQSLNSATVTLLDSLDSSSRSHTTLSHEVSPSELPYTINERSGKSPLVHNARVPAETLMLVDDVGANCGNNPRCSIDIASKAKCLQLFSEEKSNDVPHMAVTRPDARTYMVSEERNTFQLASEINQLKQTSSRSLCFLDLSLPMEPNFGGCSPKNFSTTLPLLNSSDEFKDLIHSEVNRSSFSQTSKQRHKMVLDSIMNRARALNERGSFQDQFKPYANIWSEEELDFLWIGVRRHGRDNWDAILGDSRLHFAPWRVGADLAERWEEEQFKLLNGTFVSQFKYSKPQGVSLGCNDAFFHPTRRVQRENMMDKTQLSLGGVYAHIDGSISKRPRFDFANMESSGTEQVQGPNLYQRTGPYSDFKGEVHDGGSSKYFGSNNLPMCDPLWSSGPFTSSIAKSDLPHWLRKAEAVTAPHVKPAVPAVPPGTLWVSQPSDPSERHFGPRIRVHSEFTGLRSSALQPSTGAHHNFCPGIRHGIDEQSKTSLYITNKPNELIIIESDASSEETISDDHTLRP